MTIAALSWPEATVYATAIASAGLVVAVLIWSIFRTGQAAIRSERKIGIGDRARLSHRLHHKGQVNECGMYDLDRLRSLRPMSLVTPAASILVSAADGSLHGGAPMTRLSEFVIARRRWIVAAWVLLTVVGVYATGRLSDRWFESFSIPGYQAYEANQRALDAFGSGAQPPLVVIFHADRGDVTKAPGLGRAIERTGAAVPGLTHELVLLDGE